MKKFFDQIEVYLGTIVTMIMVVILFANIIGRYVLGHSIPWAEEVCLMLFALSAYLGACGAIRTRQHIHVEFVVAKLKPKGRMVMEILGNIAYMVFNVFIIFGIYPLVMQLYRNKTAAAVSGIPKFIIYLLLLIVFALMEFRLIQDSFQRVKDYQNDPTGEKKAQAELEAMQNMIVDVDADEKEGE